MARIRTIKPEFFTSEDIVSLTPLARILYIGLWCEADREGRLNWKPRTLKMKYLPADNADMNELCGELIELNLVSTYEVDGRQYAVLPTFRKHQSINIREAQSSIPEPPHDVHVHAREKDAWFVTKDVAETVLARDGHKCVRCGSKDHLQIDHIFPKSIGGTNALTNLRVLCRSCNAARPVAGKALLDDLLLDGLTMQDMESTCMHVKARGEGKGREGKGKEGNGVIASPNGSRLPADWVMTDEMEAFCKTERPDLVPSEVACRFSDYWHGVAGQKGRKADWLATWRNWVRNEKKQTQSFAQQAADIARTTVPSKPGRDPALLAIERDRAKATPPPPEILAQIAVLKGATFQ